MALIMSPKDLSQGIYIGSVCGTHFFFKEGK